MLFSLFHKLASLKHSKFRSKFRLNQKDRDYIATKGLETIKEHAFQFVNSRVAAEYPKNDGKQTPMSGHPKFIAQRATATYRGFKWQDKEPSGAASIEWYHRCVETGDVAIRQRIIDYNEDDCIAMRVLLDATQNLTIVS